MPRYKLVLEYDGTPFVGWQRQANGPSVQDALEGAIQALSGEVVSVTGAGRTDAGVHALGQCAHFDLAKPFPADVVRDALNAHLRPEPIVVLAAEAVAPEFNARFSARERRYRYRILNRRSPPVLERNRLWHRATPLDDKAMHEAAQRLVGRYDFSTFRSADCQARSPIKTLDRLDVTRTGESIEIDARARSFLHNQVRIMVGSLALVGEGQWTASDVSAALKARAREKGGPTAPACGLYLAAVIY
ncbi:MAG TPA: tRNA pseudouridine(38-40) synthase TruA [Alphaproteobacteria bacterium]|nr:tRNA pseudouridine(38-40) synthase TruA [Alphaproteobacteria bacterium]